MPSKSGASISTRPDERVMVFIDGSNLYHVLTEHCGRHDLQFDKFGMKLANGRDLRRVYYYNIRQAFDKQRPSGSDQERFLQSLDDTPYVEVKLGIWKQRGEAMVEKGVDVMIATDLVMRAFREQYDTAILVSGDADFYPAIQVVKDLGKQVEVAAFDSNISPEAARAADAVQKLTKTFFTSLWTTGRQSRSRNGAQPKVTEEASSPEEDEEKKAAAPSRRRTARTRQQRGQQQKRETAKPEEKPAEQPASAAAPEKKPDEDRGQMRRTPTRRRVGGTAPMPPPAPVSNGAETFHSQPQQPVSSAVAVEQQPQEADDGTRRSSWLRRFGLRAGETEGE